MQPRKENGASPTKVQRHPKYYTAHHTPHSPRCHSCGVILPTLEDLEPVFAELQRAKQQASVLRFMVEHPYSHTDVIARKGGAINVPDCVKHLRPKLERHGFVILHYVAPRENRFGELSPLHRWYVGRLQDHIGDTAGV